MMHTTEYDCLMEDRHASAGRMRFIMVAAAGTACAAFVLLVGQSATNLLISPSVSAISTTSSTFVAPSSTALQSASVTRAINIPVAESTTMQADATASQLFNIAPQLMVAFGVPLAAVGALLLSFHKTAKPVPMDAISIAPVTGYKVLRASTALNATPSGGVGERYEVELEKPIGITLARGNDGATYVLKVPPGPRYAMFTPGDRVTKCSASFGPDIWEALNYGQVMFAIKTRNGNVYLELEKRGGDMSIFESNKSSRFERERNSGNYGSGTAELQMKNYAEAKELEKKREAMWREAVDKVGKEQYEEALVMFENIIGLEPNKFIADNFALTTELFRVSHYQMACVYSRMGNADAALESLREAMNAGFDDFKQVRSDPDLALVRETDEFEELMGRYDESPFNTDAINALKGMFGGFFGGKK